MKVGKIKCDSCGKLRDDCSPPDDEAYEQGWIHIERADVLLNNLNRGKDHAKTIENGDFCSLNCLIKKLQKIRKWK